MSLDTDENPSGFFSVILKKMDKPIDVNPATVHNNKSLYDIREERDAGRGRVRDLAHNNTVTLTWGMNKDTVENRVVSIKMGDKEAYVSVEELLRYLRWV